MPMIYHCHAAPHTAPQSAIALDHAQKAIPPEGFALDKQRSASKGARAIALVLVSFRPPVTRYSFHP